jgi:ubiquinol-cytochrome c reductase iron-sulfur subunit
MKKITQNYIVLTSSIVIALVILAIFVGFSKTETTLAHREKIYPYDLVTLKPSAIPVKINDIKPNSAIYFMYPPRLSPLGPENHFQKFMLIRLPIGMGGGNNDVSSFRAYSAVDLASHCQLKYWENFQRQRIEDPCTSPPYRAIDGISENWPNSNLMRAPSTGALPMLELSVDSEGYIYVEPPKFSPEKNGVIGIGRTVSEKEFREGTEQMTKFANILEKLMSSFYLPENLSTGHKLQEVSDQDSIRIATYTKPNEPNLTITYEFCNCTKTYKDFLETEGKKFYGDFWQVNGTDVYGYPNKIDARNGIYSWYTFSFYKDGFRVVFTTNLSFDDGMNLILANYFKESDLSQVKKIDLSTA